MTNYLTDCIIGLLFKLINLCISSNLIVTSMLNNTSISLYHSQLYYLSLSGFGSLSSSGRLVHNEDE